MKFCVEDGYQIKLGQSQTQAELNTEVGYGNQSLWGGALIGIHWMSQKYQEFLLPPPFNEFTPVPNHDFLSLQFGGSLSTTFNIVELRINGGVLLPLSFTQSPQSQGEFEAIGHWVHTEINFNLNESFVLGIYGRYMRLGADFQGPAEYGDPFFPQFRRYTQASGFDQGMGGGLSFGINL